MSEVWKNIPTAIGFEASSLGRIRRHDGYVMALQAHRLGYQIVQVRMADTGKRRSVTVHSLVAAAFLGPRPQGLEIAHRDHDKTNNRPGNLDYVTHIANVNGGHALKAPCFLPWNSIPVGGSFISSTNVTQARHYASRASSRYQKAFNVQHVGRNRTLVTRVPMLDAMTCSATAEIGGAQ